MRLVANTDDSGRPSTVNRTAAPRTSKTALLVLVLAMTIGRSGELPARAAGPNRPTGANELVAALSWDAVDYDELAWKRWPKPVGTAAQRLIEIGIPATPALLTAFRDPSRAVAAHLILCQIWFPKQMFTGQERLYRGNEFVGIRFDVHDLVWTTTADHRSTLNPSSVGAALRAWCRYLPNSLTAEACTRAGGPSRS